MPTTLLTVDDSVTMQKVLEITFASEDYRLIAADSAASALARARTERPLVALVDVTLADQDGYALCKALKAEAPHMGVVVLASKQGPYDPTRGSSAGADDFIDKPFDTQQLIDKVRKLVQAKAAMAAQAPAPVAPAAAPVAEPAPAKPPTGTLPGAVPGPLPMTRPTAPSMATPVARGPEPRPASPFIVAAPPAAPTPAAASAPGADAVVDGALPSISDAVGHHVADRVAGLGLTAEQASAVVALSRELVERVVWEVVPVLAETLIKEELQRLMREG